MGRRFLCLFFPCLAVDRFQREDPTRRRRTFAITREDKGHLHIAAANIPAGRGGVAAGMRLADARALLPNLEIIPDDPESTARVRQRLVEWCDRYSPLVSHDGLDGLVLDITGCTHLFGGEAALLSDIRSRIERTGYRVQGAIADTRGAAWALARYGKQLIVTGEDTLQALDPLPVEALRLPEETVQALRRVGLTTIAALQKIPRQSLVTRYGPMIVLRLDQALNRVEEPIAPYREPAPHRAGRMLAEPIGTVDAVQHVLLELLKEVCSRLEKDHLGARRLDLDCYRVDGMVARCQISTSKPVHSIKHLMRLFAEKLHTVDAGFGIETLILSARRVEADDPVQLTLSHCDSSAEDESLLHEFVDRLGMRLGVQSVCRFQVCESFLPEYSVEFRPIGSPAKPSAEWPESRIRPLRLIDPPMPIEVSAIFPGELPVQFRIGRQMHRIVRVEGPERLTPEWWRDERLPWGTRDYYRIENEQGSRFWIFQAHTSRWYLHGHLP